MNFMFAIFKVMMVTKINSFSTSIVRQPDLHGERVRDRQKHRQTEREMEEGWCQIDRQAERRTDRQIESEME